MSTAAVVIPNAENTAHREPAPRRPAVALVQDDLCTDCGNVLGEAEEYRCSGCLDLDAHMWCRDCGAVLKDSDLSAGVCADCTA
ncbi:hypothetical protein GCM10012320_24860 [Sinomonas cellulolyticus]|jgi:hypothetical protein|uniref:DZANK-type domain-containing protein n=1 Tax=Sinomonas cellulolyticus TaxID=2801916 RepID=A0ABS1K0P4_9MICC|nr:MULTISPECIES: hypothetical protein [Sinomonas]MBL0705038.1 hypothetical protein [Sinomonas cellulolyticus]GHG53886.1 hypothetical protein GCM10012320_24860 [Sinomonas sp. KCTC 49339]